MNERDMTLQEVLEDLAWSENSDGEQQAFEAWLDSPEGVDYVNFCSWQATANATARAEQKGYSYA